MNAFKSALCAAGFLALAVTLPAFASAQTLPVRLHRGTVIVCAHRGWLASDRPENSLRTMRETEQRGAFMLEMDLAITGDGQIILMHDRTIDRTTDGHGAVAALTTAEIRRFHLRARGSNPSDEAPPLFADILGWAHTDPAALLMLDIKSTPPAAAMLLVRHARMTNRVLLLTFDRQTATQAFASDPSVLVSVLIKSDADLDFYRHLAGDRQFAAYIPLDDDPALFERAHDQRAVVITDLLDPKNPFLARPIPPALHGHFTDIVVTNAPVQLSRSGLASTKRR